MERDRKKSLGVPLPPRMRGDSEPPENRVLRELKNLADKFDDDRRARDEERGRDLAWRASISDRLDEHSERIKSLESAQREAKDAATSARRTEEKVDRMNEHLIAVLNRDADQSRDIGLVKAELASIGRSEGAAAGRSYGAVSGVIGALVIAAIRWVAQKIGIPVP